ncbi:sensor domain-containing protein [Chenggangzhangella methanolivorans]|uniref:EAL domain-containing protein n=2 Tax=Chenggangzhangella methanolivorans TaxID=1437009 RepID=A0A9E6RDP0_9HYPH|nr:EAL domain-containing protein [Chenggangzhangella methanolivorans]QZO01434.1 EAL domain-containing protein [Chenggangzhangella methanolivorans]
MVCLTVLPAAAELQRRMGLFSALRQSESRFRLLAENTTDIIVLSSLDTTRRYVSPACKALLGYEPEELVGTRPLDFVHPDDREGYAGLLASLSASEVERAVTRQRYRRKDGAWVWLEVSFSLTHDEASGAATGYVASLRDVTLRRNAEEALRVSEERLALALDSGSDGIWDWDLESGALELSDHWFSTLGYDPSEMEPRIGTVEEMIHPDDVERARQLLGSCLKGQTPTFQCEYRLKTKAGGYAWALARGKVVSRSAEGRALRMVGTHIDITRRKQAELQIEHMAHHDALTGLPNRTLFRQKLLAAAVSADRGGRQFAVLACDLDRFKSVNDTRGHAAGDAVLRVVAERLRSALGEHDVAARLGGDEFAVILGRIDRPHDAAVVAQRIVELVGRPIDVDGQVAAVGVSVGVALGQGDPGDQIFRNADTALYRAKAEGRNVYRFFEPGMDAAFIARNQLEADLQVAARERGFALAYQPIVSLETGRVGGFEALMRWPHPTRGMVSPAEFIPLAEETGLIVQMGDWALREACAEAAAWPSDLRLAVNVSAVQFERAGLERSVVEALESSGLAPSRLELEITESVLMQDAVGVVSALMRLRALGVRIALDDFGTGYSSLSYLRRFPFNKIKIDRSFITEIEDPEVAEIVRAIVGLGQRSGASITAEGVETARQLEAVRALGCTEVQGFHFSGPLAPAAARDFIATDLALPRPRRIGRA